jgi:hypothetical protein
LVSVDYGRSTSLGSVIGRINYANRFSSSSWLVEQFFYFVIPLLLLPYSFLCTPSPQGKISSSFELSVVVLQFCWNSTEIKKRFAKKQISMNLVIQRNEKDKK